MTSTDRTAGAADNAGLEDGAGPVVGDGAAGAATAGAPVRSLKRRLLSGGAWTIGGTMFSMSLRLASNLILTRLLMPEAFGLMAMVITVHVALELVSDVGIRLSVVRSDRGDDPHFLRAAWSVQLVRAGIGAILVAVMAGLVGVLGPALADPSTVYADPLLPWLLLVSSLQFFIQGSASVSLFLAERHINYTKFSILELSSHLVSTLVTIALAFATESVWALVIGTIMGMIYRSALSHFWLEGPRMRWAWDGEIASELWNYGKWLIGASILTYVSRNVHRLLLAGLMAAGPFGVLSVALIWVEAGAAVLVRLNGYLIFQTLSEVRRTDPERLARIFARTLLLFDIACALACAVCVFGAELLITTLYEEQMHGAAQHLQVLGFLFLTMRFQIFNSQMLSKGDSKGHLLSMALEAVAVCIAVPLGWEFAGVEGALGALVLGPIAAAPVAVLRAGPDVGANIPLQFVFMVVAVALCGGYIFL